MAKGQDFERKICKELGLWWTGGERDDIFWRSAGSGGRATERKKKGKTTANSYGDIMAMDPIGQPLLDLICFELKRGYGKWSLLEVLGKVEVTSGPRKGYLKPFEKFVKQVLQDKEISGSNYACLIIKMNVLKPIIIMEDDLFNQFELHDHLDIGVLSFFHPLTDTFWQAITLEDFFERAEPESAGA